MNPNTKRHVNIIDHGWEASGIFFRRRYETYNAYLEKQGEKLRKKYGFCKARSLTLREKLRIRLGGLEVVKPGTSVLCLGARLGGEVQAFIDVGCFAVGIDINPGEGNQYVLHGDFHHIQFTDKSIDVVYTNCLDHALEPIKLLAEIHRILKQDGLLLLEAKAGSDEPIRRSVGSDYWDCLEWPDLGTLEAAIGKHGFQLHRAYHDKLSRGMQNGFIFRRV